MKMSKNVNAKWVATCALTVVGLSAASCGSETVVPENDYTTMCQDSSYVRIEDKKCEIGTPDHDSGSMIMFISTSSDYHAHAYGNKIDQSRVVKTVPAGKTIQKAAIPPNGGVVKSSPNIKTITHGGFGVSGKGGSSGG